MPSGRMAAQPDLAAMAFHADDAGSCLENSTKSTLQRDVNLWVTQQLAQIGTLAVQGHGFQKLLCAHFCNDAAMLAKASAHHVCLGGTHQVQSSMHVVHDRQQGILRCDACSKNC